MKSLDDRIKNVMASILSVSAASLHEDSSPDNVPGWDSLKHMNLILALEQEFGVTIPDEDVPNLSSFKLIKLVMLELLPQS